MVFTIGMERQIPIGNYFPTIFEGTEKYSSKVMATKQVKTRNN